MAFCFKCNKCAGMWEEKPSTSQKWKGKKKQHIFLASQDCCPPPPSHYMIVLCIPQSETRLLLSPGTQQRVRNLGLLRAAACESELLHWGAGLGVWTPGALRDLNYFHNNTKTLPFSSLLLCEHLHWWCKTHSGGAIAQVSGKLWAETWFFTASTFQQKSLFHLSTPLKKKPSC